MKSLKQRITEDATDVLRKLGVLSRDAYRSHGKFSENQINKIFGSFAALRDRIGGRRTIPFEPKTKPPVSNPPEKTATEVRDFGKDKAVIATINPNVRTLEDLLAYMKIDREIWDVERCTINKWEVAMREPATTVGGRGTNATVSVNSKTGSRSVLWTREDHKPLHEPLFQVKAWLVRKKKLVQDQAFEKIEQRIVELMKPLKVPIPRTTNSADHLLEVSLYDAHFGLLAWGRETDENYDLKIAEERFAVAIYDLLNKATPWNVEEIVFPIGNDFFHVNNPESVTPKNRNELDVDGRLAKIVESGEAALITAIRACTAKARTRVIWVPGNHDPQTSYFMCRIIKAAFHGDKRVQVDVDPNPRKYVRYGCNLIGYTHGDEEPHVSLPTIMAGECPECWAATTHREWHLGHFHKKKETQFLAGDTFGAVSVKIIPSICGTDAWHYRKGYVCGDRVAEAFLFNKHTGLTATFTSRNVRSIGS